MSEKDFSRVPSGSKGRSIGQAPNMGKVHRSPQSGVVKKISGRRIGASRKRKSASIVSIGMFAMAFLALATIVIFWIQKEKSLSVANLDFSTGSSDLKNAFSKSGRKNAPELTVEEAITLVEQALKNKDASKVTEFFRLGNDTSPETALRILTDIAKNDGGITKINPLGSHFTNGIQLEEVVIYLENENRTVNRLAQILPDGNGKWSIDFDSYVRVSKPNWESIVSGASPVSTVRVFISTDNYYNAFFSDENTWSAYAIVSPDSDQMLYAYAKADSPQNEAIKRILSSEEKLHKATLEIRTVAGASLRQFQISKVIAENWVVGETPFDVPD